MAIAGSANQITVLDLITEVLSLFGQYVPGETIATADSQSLLFTLNGILDGLGSEKLGMYASASQSYTIGIAPNKPTYTLGPNISGSGSDFLLSLAPEMLFAVGAYINSTTERPLRILTDAEWSRLTVKYPLAPQVEAVYIARGAANQTLTLTFYPTPSQPLLVVLYFRQPIQLLSSTANTLILPFGYQEFLTYDLAIKAAPKFGANLPAWVYTAWKEAKTRIKEANYTATESRIDLPFRGRGWVWDINRG